MTDLIVAWTAITTSIFWIVAGLWANESKRGRVERELAAIRGRLS